MTREYEQKACNVCGMVEKIEHYICNNCHKNIDGKDVHYEVQEEIRSHYGDDGGFEVAHYCDFDCMKKHVSKCKEGYQLF